MIRNRERFPFPHESPSTCARIPHRMSGAYRTRTGFLRNKQAFPLFVSYKYSKNRLTSKKSAVRSSGFFKNGNCCPTPERSWPVRRLPLPRATTDSQEIFSKIFLQFKIRTPYHIIHHCIFSYFYFKQQHKSTFDSTTGPYRNPQADLP